MARVRFDPTFIDDPRWERLGVDAYVLHSAACSYVVRSLTDGFISAARVATLTPLVADPVSVAQRCVDDGLWLVVDGGFHVCDCIDDQRTAAGRGDEQPSRASVERERARTQERKAKWRQQNAEGNGVPTSIQSTPTQSSAVQASPSPALPAPHVVENAEGNGVPDEPVVPAPAEIVEQVRATRRQRQVAKARGAA